MIEPRPSVTRFVNVVARAERARGGSMRDSDIAQRIMTKFHQELAKLIGPAGFDVLLARSVVLARRLHPVLAGITVGPSGTILGLDAATGAVGLDEAAIAVVSHFVELLVVLIGEDLAMGLLRSVWPTAVEEPTAEKKEEK